MSITQKDFQALQPGVNELYQAQAQKKLSAQQAEQQQRLEALKSLLQGNSQAQAIDRLKAFMQKDENGNAVVPEGSGMSITPEGAAYSRGINPAQFGMQQQRGEAQAIQQAQNFYKQGLPKVQQTIQASIEGLNSINDPENPMSKGQFLGAVTRSLGLSRFPNAEEAKQLLPPTAYGTYMNVLNYGGGNDSPLPEPFRKAGNSFFQSMLDSAKSQHDILKQNSVNAALSSPFATQNTPTRLQNLGAPIDNLFNQTSAKFQSLPQTSGPNLTSQPQPGVVDRLKSYFGAGGQQSAPQAQTQSGPHGDAVVQDGVTYKWNPKSGQYE